MALPPPSVHSVLVRPKNAANIGAAARATANISKGGSLILISARTSINSQAKKMAAGAQKTLNEHLTYKHWEDFLAQHTEGIFIGLSRRKGKHRKNFSLPEALTRSLSTKENLKRPIYLIFGPEEDGLSSEDLDQCHMSAFLPAYGDFKSLNLAQAVLLAHYVCAQALEKIVYNKDSYFEGNLEAFNKSLSNQHNGFPNEILKKFIDQNLGSETKEAQRCFQRLRQMILRATPNRKELELFSFMLAKSMEDSNQPLKEGQKSADLQTMTRTQDER